MFTSIYLEVDDQIKVKAGIVEIGEQKKPKVEIAIYSHPDSDIALYDIGINMNLPQARELSEALERAIAQVTKEVKDERLAS